MEDLIKKLSDGGIDASITESGEVEISNLVIVNNMIRRVIQKSLNASVSNKSIGSLMVDWFPDEDVLGEVPDDGIKLYAIPSFNMMVQLINDSCPRADYLQLGQVIKSHPINVTKAIISVDSAEVIAVNPRKCINVNVGGASSTDEEPVD